MESQTTKQRRGEFSPKRGIRGAGILLTDTEPSPESTDAPITISEIVFLGC
jgi:hypothetical protein